MASWKSDGIIESMKPKPSEKDITEPFIEAAEGDVDYSYDASQYYDFEFNNGKNFNEKILGSTINTDELVKTAETVKTEAAEVEKSYMDQLNEIRQKADLKKFRQLIANLIKAIPESINRTCESFAELVVAFYYLDPSVSDALAAKRIIIGQLNLYLTIPFTFWLSLNWWYVWNYTHFSFNFMDALKYPPFNMMYYVFEPGFYVLELMNYYILTMRVDAKLACWKRDFLNTMWDWRPVIFTIFALGNAGMLQTMPVSDTAGGMVSGDTTAISGLIFIGTIVAFVYLTLTCMARMIHFNELFQNAFLLAFMMLLFFLFVLIVAGFASSIAVAYFAFFSQMVLICFERFNFIAKIQEMFNDLKTAPVSDPDATLSSKPYTYIKQFIFRNFFGLCWVFCGVLPMCIYSLTMASSITNFPMMVTIMIFITILDIGLLYPAVDILSKLSGYLSKIIDENTEFKFKDEERIDRVPPPIQQTTTGVDNSGSIFNDSGFILKDFILAMMNPTLLF
jgi:hypothetical protein